ncbi:MAG: hypothetical protein QOJ72_2490 [Nocardioidaceae bacterium]|nr:hypothetical protein [Nocardioidaceae bacterium]
MTTRRDERGQGSLESVGMIVLAAVLTTTVVGTVATQVPAVSSTVCKSLHAITQNAGGCGDSTTTAPPKSEKTSTTPESKPRTPVCTSIGSQKKSNGFPEGQISVKKKTESVNGMSASNETTIKIGNITVDQNGYEWQTSSVISDIRLTEKAKAELKGVKLDTSLFAGHSTTYAITVPPSSTGDLTAGIPPNPFDPASIPVGGNVTLTGKTYAGLGLDASYKLLRGTVSSTTGVETSTAVIKLPDGKVRVLVGPANILENSLKLGFGTENANIAAYVDDKYTDYKLSQADFDLSTPAGKSAYYAMVLGGQTPESDGGGVSNRANVEGSKYTHRAGISGKIGSLEGKLGSGHDQEQVVTDYADGHVTYTSKANENGVDIVANQTVDAQGHYVPSQSTFQIRLHNVSPDQVNRFNERYGHSSVKVDKAQDVVIDFTQAELDQQKAQAYDIIADGIKNDPDWVDYFHHQPTGADVKKFVADMTARHDDVGRQMIERIGGSPNSQRFQAMQVVQAKDGFANLVYMLYGQTYGTNPANTLGYLEDWQIALENADINNEDIAGIGNTLCRDAG